MFRRVSGAHTLRARAIPLLLLAALTISPFVVNSAWLQPEETRRAHRWDPATVVDQASGFAEVSEEHLDLLAILARLLVPTDLRNVASDIPCRFMDAASDLLNLNRPGIPHTRALVGSA